MNIEWIGLLFLRMAVGIIAFLSETIFIQERSSFLPQVKALISLVQNSILCRVSLASTPLLPSPLSPKFHELNCLGSFRIPKKLHFISLRIAVLSRPSAMFEIARLARKYVGSAARSINNFSFCPQ